MSYTQDPTRFLTEAQHAELAELKQAMRALQLLACGTGIPANAYVVARFLGTQHWNAHPAEGPSVTRYHAVQTPDGHLTASVELEAVRHDGEHHILEAPTALIVRWEGALLFEAHPFLSPNVDAYQTARARAHLLRCPPECILTYHPGPETWEAVLASLAEEADHAVQQAIWAEQVEPLRRRFGLSPLPAAEETPA